MIIPWQELEPDTLTNLLEHFVLQEGTEYGEQDVSLIDKVEAVRQQLLQGSAVLVYSELHESVNVVPKTHLSKSPTDDFPQA
ncbi:YheU family protein [Aeromonas caviae]|uniref:YheU family protein n=1 Tax=Aeromonas caviae TaxID=648 RepID=UPI001920036C|nr:YheU family protein [Aeromonas caviae]MBL0606714.1 YheU family protein [Aeromonas caviae]MDX7765686.1 YheU family protein [Aeromonas caviae]